MAVTTLGINVSWGTPGTAKTSAGVLLRGSADIGIGFSAPAITWSAEARANARAVAEAEGCSDRSFADAAGALPSPCRYGVPAPGQPLMATLSRHAVDLQRALDALARGDFEGARTAARKIDSAADHLVMWMAATSGSASLSAAEMAEAMATLADWPNLDQLRLRYELALARERPAASTVLAAFADAPPTTAAGTIQFAQALAASGRKHESEELVRRYWRESVIGGDAEQAILSAFSDTLTAADRWARVATLIYRGKTAEAERASRLLEQGPRDLAAAWIAATRQRAGADSLLDALAPEQQQDPACLFARVGLLHQAGKIAEAANLMLSAPTDPAVLIDPAAWSEERRVLARALAEQDPRTAFDLTSADLGATGDERVESEIDAGWYALRYLADPAQAERHFRASTWFAKAPSDKAQAEYWMGRTADALGRYLDAAVHYGEAGRFPTSFYGQLALARLGTSHLPIAPPPHVDQRVERDFLANEQVQAAGWLAALGRMKDARVFYRHLAETLTDPAEITLLAQMAQGDASDPLALRLGKLANAKRAGVAAVAFPVAVIPALDREDVELPAIYAVARQESEFQMRAVSPVGAQGLLQLMPATAREVAGRLGLPYSRDRLGTDPTYNATLGAAFLGSLLAQFDGSYALSFAAYNAGAGRVQQWTRTYGDPRRSDADVVDWIERIPFDETRNYVKRTLENLQVYRARLGMPALRLEADLTGQPGEWRDPLASVPRKNVVAEVPTASGLAGQSGEDSRHADEAPAVTRVSFASTPAVKQAALAAPLPVVKTKAASAPKAKAASTAKTKAKAAAADKGKGKTAEKGKGKVPDKTQAKGQHSRHKGH